MADNQDNTLLEVQSHYNAWTQDVNQRLTRKNGWNDITDAYYGKLPNDWPFNSKTSDPRIRTALLEKNARLTNGKLRGRLVPREGGDIIKARINNTKLDYDWDHANDGGSMQVKISMCDMDARLYQSKFALVPWRCDYDDEGEISFEGNELQPLDIRDCGMDFSATHIKNAKWFQYRTWEFLEDMENAVDTEGKKIYNNLDLVRSDINLKANDKSQTPSTRKDDYQSRVKANQGLEDRVGTDIAFPVIEVVHELRDNRWIDFSPDHGQILRDIESPYELKKIHVAQLRYYSIQDDALGESEVESVLPLWKAIQAALCGYMDEAILKSRPPLKILEGQARLETIVYNPEAQWLMSSLNAVTEMQSSGQAIQYFQSTYPALVSAFNNAMGMQSQGISNLDGTQGNKTATEVKASTAQQNARDEKNQTDLAEFIKDIMMFWLANNNQFVFSDPNKKEYLLRIIGKENFAYFQQAGLDAMDLPPESAQMIKDIIDQNQPTVDANGQQSGGVSQAELDQMTQAGSLPRYPVVENPGEKNPAKLKFRPKMKVSDTGDVADISMVPEDQDGVYDYVPDVRSMRTGADQELIQGRQNMINTLITGPASQNVLQLLAQEGYRPKIKELLGESFEDLGMKDSDRYFEKLQPPTLNGQPGQVTPGVDPNNPAQAGLSPMGSPQPPSPQLGLPQLPQAVA